MATQFLEPALASRREPAPAAHHAPTPAAAAAPKRYLFGPVTDFLCLGGSSLLILPLLMLLPEKHYEAPMAIFMLSVAHLVNHPHFAHSYQIFYRDFGRKAFGDAFGRTMRRRYVFAGIVAPALLVAFCLYGTVTSDAQLLGYGANLMALAVGWHYVKQGYGMLMVDAALKRRFFDDPTKTILLANCYAVWIASWLQFNASVNKYDLWGLAYYTFAVPAPITLAAIIVAGSTGAAAIWMLAAHFARKRSLPANGLVAYFVALYVWLAFVAIDPLWGLVVPALHSIQYLVVVWRFQINYERAQLPTETYKAGTIARRLFGAKLPGHLAMFALTGAAVGYLGFWGLPDLARIFVPYDSEALTGTLFLFIFWMFINVHHYFMDSVMWRRENPDTGRYLFG